MPSSVIEIGNSAFAFAPNVAIVEFGSRDNNIQMSIEGQAFYSVGENISSIEDTLTLNESVVKVGLGAFGSGIYNNIKTIYLRYGAENYNDQMFADKLEPKNDFVTYIGLTNVENIIDGQEGDIEV